MTFAARVAENARSLVSDAELLLEHERWPRAYALAVLSCEEFGKACGLMLLSLIPDNMRSRAQPDKLLGHHQSKMLDAKSCCVYSNSIKCQESICQSWWMVLIEY